jgi:hypothetical protein
LMARSPMDRCVADGLPVRLRTTVEPLAVSDDLTGLFAPPMPPRAPEGVPVDFATPTRRTLLHVEAALGRLLPWD